MSNRRIEFYLNSDTEEPVIKTCNLNENDLVEWTVRFDRNSDLRIVLSFYSISTTNTVFNFINGLIQQKVLSNLNQINKIIFVDNELQNIISGSNIDMISNVNTPIRYATDINLISLENYPSFVSKNNSTQLADNTGEE